jgi:hypothetical protein
MAEEHIDLPTLLPPSTYLFVEVGRWNFMNPMKLPWIRAQKEFLS